LKSNPIENRALSKSRKKKHQNSQFKAVREAQKLDKRFISITAEHGAKQMISRRGMLKDSYHFLIEANWLVVISLMAASFLLMNLFFGFLYHLGDTSTLGNSKENLFWEDFFFSVQTFATIGYGYWYPSSVYSNAVMTLEAFTQLIATALATGLIFAKFSIPNAKVLFSQNAVLTVVNGKPALRLRLANARGNQIVEARVNLTMIIDETNAEGEFMRRLHELELDRAATPLFALSWLVTHEINETSPFFGLSPQDMIDKEVQLIVSLVGIDGTSSQTIHTRHFYTTEHVVQNSRFVDILKADEAGRRYIDFANFHTIEPLSMSAKTTL
jgi:inward rectifier potassium channel